MCENCWTWNFSSNFFKYGVENKNFESVRILFRIYRNPSNKLFSFFFSSLFFINFNNDIPDSRDIVIASSKRALSRSCCTHWRIRIALPSKFPFLLKNNIQKRCQKTAIVPIHTDSSRWIHYKPVRVCEITDVLACISSKSFDSS